MRLIDADALIDKYGDWYTEEGTEDSFCSEGRKRNDGKT